MGDGWEMDGRWMGDRWLSAPCAGCAGCAGCAACACVCCVCVLLQLMGFTRRRANLPLLLLHVRITSNAFSSGCCTVGSFSGSPLLPRQLRDV